MSHEVETMAYAGEVPWHGLGVPVSNELSPDEMLVAAGLDWEVKKVPLYYGDDSKVKISTKQALIRASDNKLFDIVSPNWKPLQNVEAFSIFKEFVEEGQMQMHTAGSLKDGQIVWALAKITDTFEVSKDDPIEPYILLVNPHKRGKAMVVESTAIRVVCWNTMTAALETESSRRVSINHNQHWDKDYILEMMGLAKNKFKEYSEAANFLAHSYYEKAQLLEYFTRVFPNTGSTKETSKNAQRAEEVIYEQPGASLSEGSWWQAFNAVTWMTDHELGRSADTRLTSAWFGQNKIRKEKALKLALEYA